MSVCACLRACVCKRERERAYLCMCEIKRYCVVVRERASVCVCVHVCACHPLGGAQLGLLVAS